ncbi:hypothetical protein JGU71_12670 [Antrihabitans sp. YC3-6]|uniref:Uncharacterized protein n=1 Tax=Antrihabitans stalagmiti TaxID=2799499 RepID=A0A934NQU8_9NOCA|nr:hypothetical protein [Antrihabitans stalagmiti]MBJ8339741.1 hypothetical protein [Antrihabitans stalagmiti]
MMSKAEEPRTGIALPSTFRGRSSTEFARAVLADAVRSYDADLAQAIESSRQWRSQYPGAFRALTALSASSPTCAVGIAGAGLRRANALARYLAGDGTDTVLADDAWRAETTTFTSQVVRGSAEPVTELRVPFGDTVLSGAALRAKLVDWRNRGIVEPSFVAALERVVDNPKWLALPGHQVVVVGADSEMGPYSMLTQWGADVLAVDLPDAARWNSITARAEAGAGSVTYPFGPAGAGADVRRDFGGLLEWIYANTSKRKKLVFGMYAYADGRAHVEVTLATDLIAADLLANRSNVTLAYLATPTDCYAVKADVMAEARRRWASRGAKGPLEDVLRFTSRSALFRPNYLDEVVDFEGNHWGLADTQIRIQGPNYALAKRLQRWRGIVTRASGANVSFNVAPASWTESVTKNQFLASAYHGAKRFGVEIFEPQTASALLAAKLVHDVFVPAAVDAKDNPVELFYEGAAHGGLWRLPFEPGSALGLATAVGALSNRPRFLERRLRRS